MAASGLPFSEAVHTEHIIFNLMQLFKNVMFMCQMAKYVVYICTEKQLKAVAWECKNVLMFFLVLSLVSLNLSYIKSDCTIVWIT